MALDSRGRVIPDAPTTGWRVVDQTETLEADPGGRVVNGVRVVFVTGKGIQGSVFVPRNLYNVPNVQAAVAARAHEMDQVQGLSG